MKNSLSAIAIVMCTILSATARAGLYECSEPEITFNEDRGRYYVGNSYKAKYGYALGFYTAFGLTYSVSVVTELTGATAQVMESFDKDLYNVASKGKLATQEEIAEIRERAGKIAALRSSIMTNHMKKCIDQAAETARSQP